LPTILGEMQDGMFERARAFRDEHTHPIDGRAAFDAFFTPKNAERPEAHGGFAMSHWCGNAACEAELKDRLKVTIRCVPFDSPKEDGACVVCGEKSHHRVLFAKSY
jgi:prolyl-tRNA synthetase